MDSNEVTADIKRSSALSIALEALPTLQLQQVIDEILIIVKAEAARTWNRAADIVARSRSLSDPSVSLAVEAQLRAYGDGDAAMPAMLDRPRE